jgi:hypothetical protein
VVKPIEEWPALSPDDPIFDEGLLVVFPVKPAGAVDEPAGPEGAAGASDGAEPSDQKRPA